MKLSIKDRIIMLELLPEKGAFLEMIAKRNIIKKLDFTSEEFEKFQIKQNTENGSITWNNEVEPTEIELVTSELDILKEGVNRLDEAKEISDRNFDTLMKIKEA